MAILLGTQISTGRWWKELTSYKTHPKRFAPRHCSLFSLSLSYTTLVHQLAMQLCWYMNHSNNNHDSDSSRVDPRQSHVRLSRGARTPRQQQRHCAVKRGEPHIPTYFHIFMQCQHASSHYSCLPCRLAPHTHTPPAWDRCRTLCQSFACSRQSPGRLSGR